MEVIVKDKKYLSLLKKTSNKLRSFRIINNLNQEKAAKELGISKATLNRIENQKGSIRPFVLEKVLYKLEEGKNV